VNEPKTTTLKSYKTHLGCVVVHHSYVNSTGQLVEEITLSGPTTELKLQGKDRSKNWEHSR
jgi:hypothetical protein